MLFVYLDPLSSPPRLHYFIICLILLSPHFTNIPALLSFALVHPWAPSSPTLGYQLTLMSMPELLIFNLRSVHEPEIIQTRQQPKNTNWTKPKHNRSHGITCKNLTMTEYWCLPQLNWFSITQEKNKNSWYLRKQKSLQTFSTWHMR